MFATICLKMAMLTCETAITISSENPWSYRTIKGTIINDVTQIRDVIYEWFLGGF